MSTRRRARVRRSTVLLLVAVVLVAAGGWTAYFSPLLVVREVAVAGQRSVAADSPLKAEIVLALLKQKPTKTINVSTPNNPALE